MWLLWHRRLGRMPKSALARVALPQWASGRGGIDVFCRKAAFVSNSPRGNMPKQACGHACHLWGPCAHIMGADRLGLLDPRTIRFLMAARLVSCISPAALPLSKQLRGLATYY